MRIHNAIKYLLTVEEETNFSKEKLITWLEDKLSKDVLDKDPVFTLANSFLVSAEKDISITYFTSSFLAFFLFLARLLLLFLFRHHI